MKILFVHPNRYLRIGIPTGIATLSAVLKDHGHEVDIFDYTFVKTHVQNGQSQTANKGLYLPTQYTLEDLVADDPLQCIEDAFAKKLKAFYPDLIAVSVMTGYFDEVVSLLERVRPPCPVVVGGVHATICPEDALAPDVVDCICVGEGEEFMLELCEHLEGGKDYFDLRNLGYKKDGNIRINELRPFVNMDGLPKPDWSLFDERHLFRPFMGQVYRGGFYIMSRGCPWRCTYCVNPVLRERQKACGRYFRYQSPHTSGLQLTALKEKYGANWFKFADDSITLFSENYLEELAEIVRPLDIMFGCSIQPETVTKRKVELLKSMGCVAASVGIESGNPIIRSEVLNRNMTNRQIEDAIHMLKEVGIRISTFNMIGLPGETRDNVFETIRLNKRLRVSAVNVYVVYPYPATELSYRYNTSFRDEDRMLIPISKASAFELSHMPQSEVEGLLRTFELYVTLPEEMWPNIRHAEGDNKQAARIRTELEKLPIEIQEKDKTAA